MCLVPPRLRQMFEQIFHQIVELFLKVFQDRRVVVFRDVLFDELGFTFVSSLALLHFWELRVRRLSIFRQLVEEICIIVISTTVAHSFQRLLILHIVEEPDNDAAEKERP